MLSDPACNSEVGLIVFIARLVKTGLGRGKGKDVKLNISAIFTLKKR